MFEAIESQSAIDIEPIPMIGRSRVKENDLDEELDVKDAEDILTDQDQTLYSDPDSEEKSSVALGSDSPSFGQETNEFIRGEIDVKEQMDRTGRVMDAAIGKSRSMQQQKGL